MKKTVFMSLVLLLSASTLFGANANNYDVTEKQPEPWSVKFNVAAEKQPEPWSVKFNVAAEKQPEPWSIKNKA